jgi:CubicO group peptidase (beta-lactamase class C family)
MAAHPPNAMRPASSIALASGSSRLGVHGARAVVLMLLLLALTPARATSQTAPLAGLDRYTTRAMADWEVPGLAIAVVRGDSVIFARGYGVREAGRPERVNEHTLFAIASTTKAMTAAALGMLVDEGRLRWDDPVTQHLPGFQLHDPFLTRHLTVRDLLTHRSGLARNDLVWIAAPFGREEILRRARYLPSVGGFRAGYGYNNIMYIAAGEVVGAVSGTGWDDFIDHRLFAPLGMHRSTTRAEEVERLDNVAVPHTYIDGRVRPVQRRNYDNIGGAGAAYSSAWEMAQWVRLHLNGGTYRGDRLLKEATVAEMHTPQAVIRSDSVDARLFPDTHFRAYGLGWSLQDYKGRKLVHHSGTLNWTRTQVGMIPAEGLGVVVIANLGSSNLQHALMYRVLDALLGEPAHDWSAEYLALARRARDRGAERAAEADSARIAGTRPSLALERYVGTYTHDLYGEMRLALEDGALVLRYSPDYVADLEHWHHDTFRATWRRPGFGHAFVTFSLDPRARAASMRVEDFGTFTRAPERSDGSAQAAQGAIAH